ncbi:MULTISPECIES: substrate-binding domain-containing protein [Pseudacidovorax]|mgnify:CR=1 FL=1|uniref:Branched-chain amino acid transport system substrate-binding protein n=1 Tax=Pseudacidovorax intermedius TaxID=433924 RepID=A0A370FFU9_9BURK|nr:MULTISPECIES: substrate-binding domain-containing protein [Pseudacidovorax]MBP6896258.1 substrate-binding domain-containing protein [Pseudacidovorax sp.]RDI25090.1 branched-chain amino acid transport system substrate-binding protein [Pseudacidovorax intermedius]
MLKKLAMAATAAAACWLAPQAFAQDKPIKIALIASKTGPSEAYARDTERGLRLGLEYLTQGSMTLLGRKIELIVKDDQMKPELSKAMLTEALADDKADIAIGTSWSGGALSMAPVAEEYGKLLMVEPAIADSLTGSAWNKYLFRASRNSFQDALASAAALKDGDNVAFLAPDYVYGKDGVKAAKEALAATKKKATVVHEEYIPLSTTDFTAPMQRIFDRMKDVQGKKYLVVIWGAPNPIRKISELNPGRYGIEFLSIGGANLENAKPWRGLDITGGTFYYYDFPKNPMNDWLVAEHRKRYQTPPDLFTAGGFVTAAAIVAGVKKANSVDTPKLIAAMEGMEFDTPKGKMTFRKEDHQALQSQYQFRMKKAPANEWDLFELVREIPASEMPLPITVKR